MKDTGLSDFIFQVFNLIANSPKVVLSIPQLVVEKKPSIS